MVNSSMLRNFFYYLGIFGPYLVVALGGVFGVLYWYQSSFVNPAISGSTEKVYFEVKKDWDIKKTAEELEEAGVINNWMSVYYISKYNPSVTEGNKTVLAGEYELSPGLTPREILGVLFSGKKVSHELLIPAGLNIGEAPAIFAASKLLTETEAYQALRDKKIIRSLGMFSHIPEGFLIEGVYRFQRPITPEQVVSGVIEQGQAIIEQKFPNWKTRAAELRFSDYQILTIASLLEKESLNPEERKNISAVYHNRLRIGMHLQSNAALIYGISDFQGKITQDDIRAEGPYNTYLNAGLPPTPICSPSLISIEAALYPADVDYLYFVSTGDGGFLYASTYREFLQRRKELQTLRDLSITHAE